MWQKGNCDMDSQAKQYLLNANINNHKEIYDFYLYHIERKPKEKHNITYIIEVLERDEYEKVQKYIKDFFGNIKRDYNKEKNQENKQKILMKINDKELFFEELNKELETAIDEYLELVEYNEDYI